MVITQHNYLNKKEKLKKIENRKIKVKNKTDYTSYPK